MNIMYKATNLGCKAILYGHTHIPHYECIDIHLLNPGSLTIPREEEPAPMLFRNKTEYFQCRNMLFR